MAFPERFFVEFCQSIWSKQSLCLVQTNPLLGSKNGNHKLSSPFRQYFNTNSFNKNCRKFCVTTGMFWYRLFSKYHAVAGCTYHLSVVCWTLSVPGTAYMCNATVTWQDCRASLRLNNNSTQMSKHCKMKKLSIWVFQYWIKIFENGFSAHFLLYLRKSLKPLARKFQIGHLWLELQGH